MMEDGEVAGLRAPRYPNEDTSKTSHREIRGWYCYSLAAEVFAVCGVGEIDSFGVHLQLTLTIIQAHSFQ